MATSWLLSVLRERGWDVFVVDTQLGRPRVGPLLKLLRCLRAAVMILAGRFDRVVVVASGGKGILAEVPPLVAARVRRRPTWLTHHSSSYVLRESGLMKIALQLAGRNVHHIVLSEDMGVAVAERYALADGTWTTVDNAALMPDQPVAIEVTRERSVLHLSHLTVSKGTLTVLDVARRLRVAVPPPAVRLAGGVHDDVRQQVVAACGEGLVEHLGVLDGRRKLEELARARVVLLPSLHEAQPLVIYEAAAAGAVPVAWMAGWIREQMHALDLDRFLVRTGDVQRLVEATEEVLQMSDDEFRVLSARVQRALAAHRVRARTQLEVFL